MWKPDPTDSITKLRDMVWYIYRKGPRVSVVPFSAFLFAINFLSKCYWPTSPTIGNTLFKTTLFFFPFLPHLYCFRYTNFMNLTIIYQYTILVLLDASLYQYLSTYIYLYVNLCLTVQISVRQNQGEKSCGEKNMKKEGIFFSRYRQGPYGITIYSVFLFRTPKCLSEDQGIKL